MGQTPEAVEASMKDARKGRMLRWIKSRPGLGKVTFKSTVSRWTDATYLAGLAANRHDHKGIKHKRRMRTRGRKCGQSFPGMGVA